MSDSSTSQDGDSHPKWLTYVLIGVIIILILLVIGSFTGIIGGAGSTPPATEAPVEPLPTEAPPEATEPGATEAPCSSRLSNPGTVPIGTWLNRSR